MQPPQPRAELNLSAGERLCALPRASLAPTRSASPMPPVWLHSSYTSPTPMRHLARPNTGSSVDLPSSPGSSQKFEVKRLLSRPADPIPSPRPFTTFVPSPFLPEPTIKRANSVTRPAKKNRSSQGALDSTESGPSRQRNASLPSQDQTQLASNSRDTSADTFTPIGSPRISHSNLPPSSSALTPASAYALAYARRTNMTTQPSVSIYSPSRRHPFDNPGGGRVIVVGDPPDSLFTPSWTLPKDKSPRKDHEKEGALGLTRKVSARFGRRRRAGTTVGAQSDAENGNQSRTGVRGIGTPARSDQTTQRRRVSRHLSIEDFGQRIEHEGGTLFEMERGRTAKASTGRGPSSKTRGGDLWRSESRRRKDESHRSKDAPTRGTSTHAQAPAEMRPSGAISPEIKGGGGKIWRLVKKISTGTLKEKRTQNENVPPVPRLPSGLPSSRRSSVSDYGEEVRPDLSQLRANSNSSQLSYPNTILQPNIDLIHPAHTSSQCPPIRHSNTANSPPLPEYRPSLTHTNESSVRSPSPKSSLGRIQSPRTSMSSYVDIGEDVTPPPLPKPSGTVKQACPMVGMHIVAPGELAQYQMLSPARDSNTSPSAGVGYPSLPPPKRPRKPREKTSVPPSLPISPISPSPCGSPAEPVKPNKPKTKILRRPPRLDDEAIVTRLTPPRSVSMGLPSPRSASMHRPSPRARSHTTPDSPSSRPRSSSVGTTVFTFRELGAEKRTLSEQEKVDKFEQLLEASEKAGGTLHARPQDRVLLSDSMRFSGTYDGSSSIQRS